ncbi:hypothetical protein LTR78_002492 [Recurvomyces mirabilis]|uniref:N-acetyltransferase domain-containing protein n=1 Tax=Recurvomyces mirabilis TaxID=574656 RepID=A0AAE0WTJ1_9PEZI|nr:hypothetical protein LTR78_002492 [Recurvomyces mirabilis]KAK5157421.1 hypothetical protein LTS14_004186 [Recurvomyces mirabilis]
MHPSTNENYFTASKKCKNPEQPGQLKLKLETDTVSVSRCLTDLFVRIKWAPEGQKSVFIGQIEGWIIDKSLRSEARGKLWVEDFSTLDSEDPLLGLCELTGIFYDSAGRRRPCYKALATELKADRFVYINKIYIEPKYRGAKLGTHALSAFHKQLRGLPECYGLAESTIILQPAFFSDEGEEPSKELLARTQQQLIRFYTKNKYSIYHQDDVELMETESTYTLMGRKLALDTAEHESEDEPDASKDSDVSDEDDTGSIKEAENSPESKNDDDDGKMSLVADQDATAHTMRERRMS